MDHILQLFDQSVDAGLDFLKQYSSELSFPVPGLSAVKCLCSILDGLLRAIMESYGGFAETAEADDDPLSTQEDSTSQLPHQTLAGIYIPIHSKAKQAAAASSRKGKGPLQQRGLGLHKSTDLPLYRHKPATLCDLISNLFVFAFIWSFGGCFEMPEQEVELDLAGHDQLTGELGSEKIARGGNTAVEKFDALVYDIFADGKISVQLPATAKMIYNYYPNVYTNTFEPFDRLISSPVHNVSFLSPNLEGGSLASSRFTFRLFVHPDEGPYYSASSVSMVPTVDIIRLSFLVCIMLESGSLPNIMLSGKSGVGKTQLLKFLSRSVSSVKWRKAVIQAILGKPHSFDDAIVGRARAVAAEEEEDPRKGTDDSSFTTTFYHISTQLESQRMQSMLGSYLMRQGKTILIPPTGRNVSKESSISLAFFHPLPPSLLLA